jgi:hypothetical protein
LSTQHLLATENLTILETDMTDFTLGVNYWPRTSHDGAAWIKEDEFYKNPTPYLLDFYTQYLKGVE